jgi:hypothetical protein
MGQDKKRTIVSLPGLVCYGSGTTLAWEEIDVHGDHGAKGRNASSGLGHIARSLYIAAYIPLPFENVPWKFTVLYNDSAEAETKYVMRRDTAKQGLFTE